MRMAVLAKGKKEWKAHNVKDRKDKANGGQGAGYLRGRAKTEGKVGTGHWTKGGTLDMMESMAQGRG